MTPEFWTGPPSCQRKCPYTLCKIYIFEVWAPKQKPLVFSPCYGSHWDRASANELRRLSMVSFLRCIAGGTDVARKQWRYLVNCLNYRLLFWILNYKSRPNEFLSNMFLSVLKNFKGLSILWQNLILNTFMAPTNYNFHSLTYSIFLPRCQWHLL